MLGRDGQEQHWVSCMDDMSLLLPAPLQKQLSVAYQRLAAFCGGPAAARDLVVITAAIILMLWLDAYLDAFELVFTWIKAHEDDEIDEIFTLLILTSLAVGAFGFRRIGELREQVAQRRESEMLMRHMALHDVLTGLPNRVLFQERLNRALAQARREGSGVAVLCLDLDRFKEINDTLGHATGDRLLREVAIRLLACVREADTVARLGGDEFVIVQVGLHQPENVDVLARRLIEALAVPFDLDEHHIATGASIGIALAVDGTDDPDLLLKNADVALYRAKAEGRGTFRFFEPAMEALLRKRRQLEQDLRRALAEHWFEIHFQPQMDLARGKPTGFEALLRLRHPERGLMLPADFIPVAEETGLILPLGEWVLRRACAEALTWPSGLRVAVNLSPAQFKHPDLTGLIAGVLRDTGLPPDRLELEITESVMLQDAEATLATLTRLRALGMHIAMDDFGVGCSSLSYLRRFPFDKIKIDRSFIEGLGSAGHDDTIVRAVIALGRSLGMAITAEGVETLEQLGRLCGEACNEVQGFYFGQPLPAAEIVDWLERQPFAGQPAIRMVERRDMGEANA